MGVLIPLAVVAALMLLAWLVLSGSRWVAEEEQRQEALDADRPPVPVLSYLVPEGRDPALIIAALSSHGIEAVPAPDPIDQRILIACTEAVGRERVRETIATTHGPAGRGRTGERVRFEDEG